MNTDTPTTRLRAVGASPRTRDAVLKAASELLATKDGYASITIEKIAARAQVAKTTVYRWWPSKIEIFMDVFEQFSTKRLLRLPESGSLELDLRHVMRNLLRLLRSTSAGAAVACMIAEAQMNPEAAIVFRDQFIMRGRTLTRRALTRAKRRGELPEEVDIDVAIDVISGAIWYRLLLGHAPLDDAYADSIVSIVLNGIHPHSRMVTAAQGPARGVAATS